LGDVPGVDLGGGEEGGWLVAGDGGVAGVLRGVCGRGLMRVQLSARGTMAGPPARLASSIGEAVARRGRATAARVVEKSIVKVFLVLIASVKFFGRVIVDWV
jgi:hypothetical protein